MGAPFILPTPEKALPSSLCYCLDDPELARLTRELHEATDAMHKATTKQKQAQAAAYAAGSAVAAATATAAAMKVSNWGF